jgi:hypothetical protein
MCDNHAHTCTGINNAIEYPLIVLYREICMHDVLRNILYTKLAMVCK